MVVLEEGVHPLDLFRRQTLHDEQSIVAHVELCTTLSRRVNFEGLGTSQGLTVIHIIHPKAFPQIPENQWTVFFDFEVGWHIFSGIERSPGERLRLGLEGRFSQMKELTC